MPVTVADIVRAVEQAYPPVLAESWDTGIGLTCGGLDDEVSGVLLAVDLDAAVVEQARSIDAQLVVTHHPLLFRTCSQSWLDAGGVNGDGRPRERPAGVPDGEQFLELVTWLEMGLSRLEIEAIRSGQALATENKRETAEWEDKKRKLGL